MALNYQPVPLLMLSTGYNKEKAGDQGAFITANITYYFGIPFHQQIDPAQVIHAKSLDNQLFKLVEREHNIRLQYRTTTANNSIRFTAPQYRVDEYSQTNLDQWLIFEGNRANIVSVHYEGSAAPDIQRSSIYNAPAFQQPTAPTTRSSTQQVSTNSYNLEVMVTLKNGQTIRTPAPAEIIVEPEATGVISEVEITPVNSNPSLTGDREGYIVSTTVRNTQGVILSNLPIVFSTHFDGAAFNPVEAITDASGRAESRLTSSRAGSVSFTITQSQTIFQESVDFITDDENTAGLGNPKSTFVTTTDNALADGVAQNVVTATLTDAEGNPVPNRAITFSATDQVTIQPANKSVTDSNGQVEAHIVSSRAADYSISAEYKELSKSTTVVFLANSGTADINNAFSSVTAAGSPALADGVSPVTVTASLRDAHDNPVADQAIAFRGADNLIITPQNNVTDSNGQISASITSRQANIYTIESVYNNQTRVVDIEFTANISSVRLNPLTQNGSPSEADGVANVVVVATLADNSGNPVADQTITFPPVSGTKISYMNDIQTTNSYGQVLVEVSSTQAGVYQVEAKYQELSQSISITFITGSPETITLISSNSSLPADGMTTATITATVMDNKGNKVPDVPVYFSLPVESGATLGNAETGDIQCNRSGDHNGKRFSCRGSCRYGNY